MEVKSGEEDEEILFKERAKLYRWDRDATQWKERGVGEIKILFHTQKKYYRVLMRRDQVLKVCANHVITKEMNLVPSDTSNNALIWTATDYAGEFFRWWVFFFLSHLSFCGFGFPWQLYKMKAILFLTILNRTKETCSRIYFQMVK